MKKTRVTIEDLDLELYDEYIKKACDKYGVTTPEEVAVIYIDKIIGEEKKGLPIREKVREVRRIANYYLYESVSWLMTADYMIPDLRPADEVCKECAYYLKGFCGIDLCNVNPFAKGCKGWERRYDHEHVTHIAKGYVMTGRYE